MPPPPQSVSRVGILVAKGGGEKRRRIRWLVMTGLFGAGFDNKEKYCGKVRETGMFFQACLRLLEHPAASVAAAGLRNRIGEEEEGGGGGASRYLVVRSQSV